MVTDISWWALDGCCYFLVGSGWLLLCLSACMILWSSLCTVMHGTVALLAATGAAPLKPQQQPLVQQNDPCLRGDMANRCTSAGPLEGQLQITCQLLSLLDVHQRPRQCGPTENTVSIDTASHLYVTFPPRCRCRHSAGRGA